LVSQYQGINILVAIAPIERKSISFGRFNSGYPSERRRHLQGGKNGSELDDKFGKSLSYLGERKESLRMSYTQCGINAPDLPRSEEE